MVPFSELVSHYGLNTWNKSKDPCQLVWLKFRLYGGAWLNDQVWLQCVMADNMSTPWRFCVDLQKQESSCSDETWRKCSWQCRQNAHNTKRWKILCSSDRVVVSHGNFPHAEHSTQRWRFQNFEKRCWKQIGGSSWETVSLVYALKPSFRVIWMGKNHYPQRQ